MATHRFLVEDLLRLSRRGWMLDQAQHADLPNVTLPNIGLGTLHQLPAKALSSNRHGHRKRSHMQPSNPSISEQPPISSPFSPLRKKATGNREASSDGRSPLPQESVQKKLFYADQCERDVLNRGLEKYQPD
jgi:hypothetical protein